MAVETDQAAPQPDFGKVLVVEDVPEVAMVVLHALQSVGHIAESAASAQEARVLLAEHAFDLILLDLQLGAGESGLDLCRSIQRAATDPDELPIIVSTASRDRDTLRAAYAAGAALVLVKPVDLIELRAQVVRLVRARRRAIKLRQSGI